MSLQRISGILLINKPQDLSSNAVLQRVKRLLGAKKAGHTGSLDPLATGMLPICLGEATKISQFLLDADKCYETTGLLGVKTSTADATGEILQIVDNFVISEAKLLSTLSEFKGNIQQVPSMFSALKHKGKPLYKYARQGIEITRSARDIAIRKLDLLSFDGNFFSLKVACSKGTYIRNLVEDIGESLGVGAHVVSLHRVYTSGFENYPMYTLDTLQEMAMDERLQCILPLDLAISHLPMQQVTLEEVLAIRQGKIIKNSLEPYSAGIRLYDEQGEFIGLGEIVESGFLKAKRLISFQD